MFTGKRRVGGWAAQRLVNAKVNWKVHNINFADLDEMTGRVLVAVNLPGAGVDEAIRIHLADLPPWCCTELHGVHRTYRTGHHMRARSRFFLVLFPHP